MGPACSDLPPLQPGPARQHPPGRVAELPPLCSPLRVTTSNRVPRPGCQKFSKATASTAGHSECLQSPPAPPLQRPALRSRPPTLATCLGQALFMSPRPHPPSCKHRSPSKAHPELPLLWPVPRQRPAFLLQPWPSVRALAHRPHHRCWRKEGLSPAPHILGWCPQVSGGSHE